MTMKKTLEGVAALVDKELALANEQHPFFHSDHEGYAVILEETEEVRAEFDRLSSRLSVLWNMIRHDSEAEPLVTSALSIRTTAQLMAAEAIQVAAMCQKFIDSKEVYPSDAEVKKK